MKKTLLSAVILVATLSALPVHARIGETMEQLVQRYGEGQKVNNTRMPVGEQFEFTKKPFGVQAVMLDGKCVKEVLHRVEGPIISDVEIKELLKANGEGHTWAYIRKDEVWMRSDHKVRAFRQPGHPDFFFIEDVAAVKDAKNGKGKLDGF